MPVGLWFAGVDSPARHALDLLDPTERDRRERYVMPADRDRFTVATVLLRTVAGDRLGIPPREVALDRSCDRCGAPHGRPRLPGTGLDASLSHSAGVVVVALADGAPVGVDVEQVAPRDTAGLARAVLGAHEHVDGPFDFYTYWCRKEAVVKATGDGLRVPLTEVLVSAPGDRARLLAYRGAPLACRLADLAVPDRAAGDEDLPAAYAAAVAVLTDRPVRLRAVHAGTVGLTDAA